MTTTRLILELNTTLATGLDPGLEGIVEIHLEYNPESGQIEDAWTQERGRSFWVPISWVWKAIGGRTDAARAYLDQLADDARFWEAS